MAQTKRKRRTTKHRGNAAGVVENRGRTGKPAGGTTAKKPATRPGAKPARGSERFDRVPSWSGAAQRAAIATGIFAVALVFLFKEPATGVAGLTLVMFAMYVPLGYYTDLWVYRRRQAKRLGAKPAPKEPRR